MPPLELSPPLEDIVDEFPLFGSVIVPLDDQWLEELVAKAPQMWLAMLEVIVGMPLPL